MCKFEVETLIGDFRPESFPVDPADAAFIDKSEKWAKFAGDVPETLPYRLHLPEKAPEKVKAPVLLFMHGAGERGSENCLQITAALPTFARTNPELRDFIIIAPQCPHETQWVYSPWMNVDYKKNEVPESWQLKTVLKILEDVIEKHGGDRDRVYVMGLSMGGYATWDLISRHPDLFAAAMPICGGADPSVAEILKDIPIQTFHGADDPTVPVQGTRNVCQAIKAAGGTKLTYTEYDGVGHNSWDPACSTEGMVKWMLSNKRSDRD